MATFKHISSKNADYGAAEAYLTFEHDEFTMKPTLDENGRLIPREDYRISSLNCGGEDFAVACMRANLRYEKNQKREDVKSHHYIISFDPRDPAIGRALSRLSVAATLDTGILGSECADTQNAGSQRNEHCAKNAFPNSLFHSLEHTIRYKKNLPINTEIETELKECADSSREWDGKMEHLLHIIT